MRTLHTPHELAFASFGRQLRRLRQEEGLSRRRLARRAGVSRKAIQMYEDGVQTSGLEAAERISLALGHTLPYLLGDDRGSRRSIR